jgi:hypothetical protein
MELRSRFIGILVLFLMWGTPICFGDHGHISGAFVRGQAMYNHTITLSVADPNFNANLGGSNAEVYSELWAVGGAVSPDTGPGSGIAQVYHASDGWGRQFHVGDPTGGNGAVIYHFVAAKGQSFSGGTVTGDIYYSGDSAVMFLAISTTMPTGGGTGGTQYYWNDINAAWPTNQKKLFDQYWARALYSVTIPAGKEFWVAVSKPNGVGSVYAQVMSLKVTATVVQNCTALAADLNGDCKVNFKDFAVMAQNWLKCSDADNPQSCPGTAGPDGFPWESN